MKAKIEKISSRRIITGTALALVAVYLLSGLLAFVTENAARKDGSLANYTVRAEDFAWSGIENRDGVLITTDLDPQMIMEKDQKLISIKFYMESSAYPGEMAAYYTEPGDQAFSVQKRVWIRPDQGETNWYIMETGMKNITAIRLDPTMYAGNILTFGGFIFNREKSFGDYFALSYSDVYNFILYTGIISSVLKFLQEMITRKFD